MEDDDTSSDSDSNGSEDNDEEREEEIDDDENEDEAEDRSDLEVDEETRQFIEMYDHVYGRHLSPSIPELERDSEDILMIQYADNGRDPSGTNASNNPIANSVGVSVNVANNIIDDENDQPSASNSNVPSTSGISRVTVGGPSSSSNANENNSSGRFLLQANFPSLFESNNMARHDESVSGNGDASNESATPGSPNTSNLIGRIHITTNSSRAGGIGSASGQPNSLSQLIQFRTQRNSNRQRRCAYLNLNRNTNPPAILQRLLGPTVAQNVNIGLGQVIANANGNASFRDATRVVVMDNGFGILSNAGEPAIDLLDQAGYLFGRSLAATLNNTPSPLHWWLEEAKVLGIESQADVCLTVCNDLIPELEAQRSLELSKTRSKRKKKSPADSNAKASQNQKQKSSSNQNIATESVTVSISRADAASAIANEGLSVESEQTVANIENLSVQATDNDNQDHGEREELMRDYDSDEVDETDDSEQGDDYDDDNSSKNDDDLEIEEGNAPEGQANLNAVNDEEDDENADEVEDDDRTGNNDSFI